MFCYLLRIELWIGVQARKGLFFSHGEVNLVTSAAQKFFCTMQDQQSFGQKINSCIGMSFILTSLHWQLSKVIITVRKITCCQFTKDVLPFLVGIHSTLFFTLEV